MSAHTATREMGVFTYVWSGQLVSVLGSTLTSFALGVWVYQRTGSATKFALISLFATLPGIAVAPLAGALIDRWDRRWVMILCDLGAGTCTFIIAVLLYASQLEVWHIYLVSAAKSIFSTSQGPAYSAATTLMVPKRHLGRASGMIQFSDAIAQTVAPIIAVVLIATVHLWGVLLIDFGTFVFAIVTLLGTRIPQPLASAEQEPRKKSLLREVIYGWSYITTRPGLFGLLVFFAVNNFLTGLVFVLSTPLVLSFASTAALGMVFSVGGVGMLSGSLAMSAWGGPKRRIYGVLGSYLVLGCAVILTGLRPSVRLIGVASFFISFSLPIIIGSSQAIWQSKVALDVQGRVFAVRRMIAWSSAPLAYLVAGPLADHVFEPLLAEKGPLAGSVGQLIGIGRGRGIALLYVGLGVIIVLTVLVAYLYPRVRFVEEELGDVISEPAFAQG